MIMASVHFTRRNWYFEQCISSQDKETREFRRKDLSPSSRGKGRVRTNFNGPFTMS